MSNSIIQVNNISKQYHIGSKERINRTFREAVVDTLTAPVRNFRDLKRLTKVEYDRPDTIWAIRDVSFNVHPGEVVGIIGRNGAGKSTILKILSRITGPTTGEAKLLGRVSSLLEVGTGFHSELTGRENIYLNGAILGMRKAEITAKFDEIVDFAGIDKFLDTPVKRYSSGMYVRLAFAVAAHLESEILLVDEVLAVGDAAFQRKCLGKMQDISSREGRTILFVSHNMPSVRKFCHRGILFENGRIHLDDEVNKVVDHYLDSGSATFSSRTWSPDERPGNAFFRINSIILKNKHGMETSAITISDELLVDINFEVLQDEAKPQYSLILSDADGNCIFGSLNNYEHEHYGKPLRPGIYTSTCRIYGSLLNAGRFFVTLIGFNNNWHDEFKIENAISFHAHDDGVIKGDYPGSYGGPIRPLLKWQTKRHDIT